MPQSPSIIQIIQPYPEILGGGSIDIITDLSGPSTPAINYTNLSENYLTPNINKTFKLPDIQGGGNINLGTPFGIFETNVRENGGVLENYTRIYNFIIELQNIS
jgi:hypothetical protein